MNIEEMNYDQLKDVLKRVCLENIQLTKENNDLKSKLNEYTLDLSKDEMEEQYRNYYN
jgi:regulator of replication initiation timing